MSLTRKELEKVYDKLYSMYRRKERDKDIRKGIDVMYNAIINYMNGEEIKRE
jgi:hypothetical protein